MGPPRIRPAAAGPVAVIVLMLAAGACASSPASRTGSVARPSPFPGAARPPASRAASPAPSSPSASGGAIVQTAVGLLGVEYRFGGEDPATGLDCSGLVRYVFEQHALDVPRTVNEQSRFGDRIRASELQAGDLIFFSTIGPGATHVGIALGHTSPGEFVHAPGTGSFVRLDRYDAPYWRDRIVGIRRVLPSPEREATRPSAGG